MHIEKGNEERRGSTFFRSAEVVQEARDRALWVKQCGLLHLKTGLVDTLPISIPVEQFRDDLTVGGLVRTGKYHVVSEEFFREFPPETEVRLPRQALLATVSTRMSPQTLVEIVRNWDVDAGWCHCPAGVGTILALGAINPVIQTQFVLIALGARRRQSGSSPAPALSYEWRDTAAGPVCLRTVRMAGSPMHDFEDAIFVFDLIRRG